MDQFRFWAAVLGTACLLCPPASAQVIDRGGETPLPSGFMPLKKIKLWELAPIDASIYDRKTGAIALDTIKEFVAKDEIANEYLKAESFIPPAAWKKEIAGAAQKTMRDSAGGAWGGTMVQFTGPDNTQASIDDNQALNIIGALSQHATITKVIANRPKAFAIVQPQALPALNFQYDAWSTVGSLGDAPQPKKAETIVGIGRQWTQIASTGGGGFATDRGDATIGVPIAYSQEERPIEGPSTLLNMKVVWVDFAFSLPSSILLSRSGNVTFQVDMPKQAIALDLKPRHLTEEMQRELTRQIEANVGFGAGGASVGAKGSVEEKRTTHEKTPLIVSRGLQQSSIGWTFVESAIVLTTEKVGAVVAVPEYWTNLSVSMALYSPGAAAKGGNGPMLVPDTTAQHNIRLPRKRY